MTIIVLGAGVIGVMTAYYLARLGHEVVVLERNAGPALGSSHANAGLLVPSQSPPWNEPGVPLRAIGWMVEKDPALSIRSYLDPATWAWLVRFARHSMPSRHGANARTTLTLARYSRSQLRTLCADHAPSFDHWSRGVLTLVREPGALAAAEQSAGVLRDLGIPCSLLGRHACLALEPALEPILDRVVCGLHTIEDEHGDAYKFCRAMMAIAASLGVRFHFGEDVKSLEVRDGACVGVVTGARAYRADRFVLALGSESRALAAAIGIDLPIYPVQGCSVTIASGDWDRPPAMPVRDSALKVAVTPLGDRVRVAGKAILNGGRMASEPGDMAQSRRALATLFPEAPRDAPATEWSGLRPMTPDGPPILGATACRDPYLNTGHGALGWTLACGSGRLVADLIAGREPEISLAGLELERYAPVYRR